jgi:Flp pilus assembly pilin Flp
MNQQLGGQSMILREMNRLVRQGQGQDLTEYTLLVAFVALVAAALFILSGDSVTGIWSQTNNNLNHGMKLSS